MRISLVQITSGPDCDLNYQKIQTLATEVRDQGVSLLALPEAFACFSKQEEKFERAENPACPPSLVFLQNLARQLNVSIAGGSIFVRSAESGKVLNRSYFVNKDGLVLGHYDKIHLFDARLAGNRGTYLESLTTLAGTTPCLVTEGNLNFGLSVCYDLRFPELYRHYFQHKADLLLIPSAFTRPTGKAHWEILLRARAIENQAFVIACNQTGDHSNGLSTYGHSLVIDPWGQVLVDSGEKEGLTIVDLDLAELQKVRQKIPCLEAKRL